MPSLTIPSGFGYPQNSINYEECSGSPDEKIVEDAIQAVREFIVPWNKRWTFVAGMLGWPYLRQDTAGNWYISRAVPYGYSALDLDPSNTRFLYAKEVSSVKGLGKIIGYDSDGIAQYQKAKVSLLFGTLSYRVRSDADMVNMWWDQWEDSFPDPTLPIVDSDENPEYQVEDSTYVPVSIFGRSPPLLPGSTGVDESSLLRYVTKFRIPGAEAVSLPGGAMKWAEYVPGSPVFKNTSSYFFNKLSPTEQSQYIHREGELGAPGTLTTVISVVELIYIWHQIPTIPIAINNIIGCVNQDWFDGYPRGTLLLTGIEARPYRWFGNQRLWDITYKMKLFAPKTNQDIDETGYYFNPYDSSLKGNYLIDNRKDKNGVPTGEYYGHNHVLRVNTNDPQGPTLHKISYQLITNDGSRPPNNTSYKSQGFGLAISNYSVNITPGTGITSYPYADFNKLFRPDPASSLTE